MVITLLGQGTIRIQSGNYSIVVDPENERVKPDVLLRTETPHPLATPGNNEVSGAGEYEISGISIRGVQLPKESKTDAVKTAYRVVAEDIALGFMGGITSVPDAATLEALGDIEILFIPAGGKPYLDGEAAAKLAKQIEPNIVIPLFAKRPKEFLDEMGQTAAPQEKLTIKKKDLVESGDGMRVLCLES